MINTDNKTEDTEKKEPMKLVAILSEEWLEIVPEWLAQSALYKKQSSEITKEDE